MKFQKLVAIEPINMTAAGKEYLKQYADEVIHYTDLPKDAQEIARRIGDADAVLVSYTTQITKEAMELCPNIKYIGMCCSLYSEESANVDIAYARTRDIKVTGIRDYGDRGVVEYVIYQLVRIFHGFDFPMWKESARELTRAKIGIIGMGVSGGMVAEGLQFMGADISYYSRTRKPEKEAQGIKYQPLDELLESNEVVITCLNKNVILLKEEQFQKLGNKKILMNTSIGPAADMDALNKWLKNEDNIFCCDTIGALGDSTGMMAEKSNVICMNASAGTTAQAFELLDQKVIDNIENYLKEL